MKVPTGKLAFAYRTIAALEVERDTLRAEVAQLRREASLYRFVRGLAWYVDRAASVYELGNSQSPWSSERQAVDADEVEAAIAAAMEGLT